MLRLPLLFPSLQQINPHAQVRGLRLDLNAVLALESLQYSLIYDRTYGMKVKCLHLL